MQFLDLGLDNVVVPDNNTVCENVRTKLEHVARLTANDSTIPRLTLDVK